jgi:predicted negative regulator of RcsB-dependent stress response
MNTNSPEQPQSKSKNKVESEYSAWEHPTNSTESEQNLGTNPVEAQDSTSSLQEQQVNLKLEVEQLYREVEGLRGWFQTLVSGLMIAIVIAIGISSWFAYRLLVQEQLAQQDAADAADVNDQLRTRLEELEAELQRQSEQLGVLKEQVPNQLDAITSDMTQSQLDVERLRARLAQAEEQLQDLQSSSDDIDNTIDPEP